MTSPFQPAQRRSVKARVALFGPSKSGKTYTALAIATGLAGDDGRVALIDAENGSASLYAEEFAFDTAMMSPPFHPGTYSQGIHMAEEAGYDVIVVDGISPAWNGPGGVLELVEKNTKGNNKFSGWAVGTPAHQELLESIIGCRAHIICTMRSATEYVIGEGNKPQKVGLKPVQRDGIEYEFHFLGELDAQHVLRVEARGEFAGRVVEPVPGDMRAAGVRFGAEVKQWLAGGASGGNADSPAAGPQPAAGVDPLNPEPASDDQQEEIKAAKLALNARVGKDEADVAWVKLLNGVHPKDPQHLTMAEAERFIAALQKEAAQYSVPA